MEINKRTPQPTPDTSPGCVSQKKSWMDAHRRHGTFDDRGANHNLQTSQTITFVVLRRGHAAVRAAGICKHEGMRDCTVARGEEPVSSDDAISET